MISFPSVISPKSLGEYLGEVLEIKNNGLVIKTDKHISAQDGLCYIDKNKLNGFLVNKSENDVIYPNKHLDVKIGVKIYRNQDVDFEKELLKPVKRKIGLNVTVENDKIILKDENNVCFELDLPNGEEAKDKLKAEETFIKQFLKTGDSIFNITNIEIKNEVPFYPISILNNLRREALRQMEEERIKQYNREKQKPLKYTNYYKESVDYRANIHNKSAKEFYEKCGCNVLEMSLETGTPQRQIELMRTKHCIKYALNMCKSSIKLYLQDEKGAKYPLKFDCKKCEMAVLSNN